MILPSEAEQRRRRPPEGISRGSCPGWELDGASGPGDDHPPVLERDPQSLQHVSTEFGHLVQEEDAVMGKAHLTRPKVGRTASEQAGR